MLFCTNVGEFQNLNLEFEILTYFSVDFKFMFGTMDYFVAHSHGETDAYRHDHTGITGG